MKLFELCCECGHEKTTTSEEVGFSHCLNPTSCIPGSHGNVSYLETCECGASRNVNQNAGCEATPWEREFSWVELKAGLLELTPLEGKIEGRDFEVFREGDIALVWISELKMAATRTEDIFLVEGLGTREIAARVFAGSLDSIKGGLVLKSDQ